MNGIRKLQEKLRERGLGKIASRVGTAALVGGPGGAAGAVLSEVASALGAPSSDPEVLYQAVANSSEADLVALRQIEADIDKVREEEATERLAISAEDAKDARQYRALDDVRKRIAAQLLIGVPLFALLVAGLDHFFDLSDMVMGALIALLGGMRQDLSSAIAFFFGTSVGSADKAKTINRMVGK